LFQSYFQLSAGRITRSTEVREVARGAPSQTLSFEVRPSD
jgi:hypothetical protein